MSNNEENGEVPGEAARLHERARQSGAAGDYDGAIKLLQQAQAIAPDWPYPTYDMAYTYLLMKDFDNARKYYEQTVRLAPRGFFTAITALDTLNREAEGELPAGTYAAYLSVEWITDPEQKRALVTAMTERLPGFAPAWKDYALLCDDPAERIDALEKGLASKPDQETKGILQLNLALALDQQGRTRDAVTILEGMIQDPATTHSNLALAKNIMPTLGE